MIASVRSLRCHSPLPRQLPMGGRRPPLQSQPAPRRKIACSALTADAPPATASAVSGCAWPTATTDLMCFLPNHNQAGITSALAIAMSWPLPIHATVEAFAGRYQTISSNCRFTPTKGQKRGCRLIQIDGRTATIVSLRFLGAGDQPGSSQRLTFVASASTTTPLLSCNLGNCRLKTASWQGRISSVSEANYDADGLAEGVPRAWAVNQGSCSVRDRRILCSADVPGGGQVSAEAQL